MSLSIERIALQGPALAHAYIEDHPRVESFYRAGDPATIDSYREVAERIRAGYAESRWESLSRLFPEVDGNSKDRLQKLIEGRGLFVATGQQAGLFLSPLFTLYKAFTAARLAAQLEEQLELPVMPLFNVASEDHDWAEVNHTHLIDLENRLARLSVAAAHEAEQDQPTPPVESIELRSDVEQALDELAQFTPESEFKTSVVEPLRDAYRPGRGVAEAFQTALQHLVGRHSFLISRTAHPHIKSETREILWAEWERRAESEAVLLERSEAISEAGFEPQVGVAAGMTQLFVEAGLGRDRILHDGEGAFLRRSGERFDEKQLRAVLEETPERVSPGALLRPVTEARAFPVVAYVGGPAEIAYLAQSQVLFDLHEIPAPVVVPRAAFRIIESKVARVLEKYDIRPDQLAGDAATAITRLLNARIPPELQESLDALRRALGSALEDVEAAALDFDPGARSALDSGKKAVSGSIRSLESRLQARVREKHEIMKGQLEKAAVNLYPSGKQQERVLNVFPYLIRYGERLLDDIFAKVVTPLD
ncbi:MAG: bacillithiol biosynthesis cysteine-adding enzyme BshC [Gemmatimonadota bacterium]|nr:MAG: bacillithiol biosynthesis cysteine-adding enzyme BshC [Gemmatimonadota bacterium]